MMADRAFNVIIQRNSDYVGEPRDIEEWSSADLEQLRTLIEAEQHKRREAA